MKLIYNLFIILMIPAAIALMSYSTGSPGGKTGSVGDGGATCTQCHVGTAQSQSGWITSDIPAEGYEPGNTYTITATGTHTGVVKFGFELTAENTAGAKKGTLILTNTTRTKFTNGTSAVTHTADGNTPSGNSNSWTMDWTAPAAGTGQIKFYAAFNAANGNGNNTGDQIYTSFLTVNELVLNPAITSVSPDSEQQGWEGQLTITGEDTDWQSGVNTISFKLHSNNSISFTPTDFIVNNDKQITANLSISMDQELGLYDLWVDNLELENAFTVLQGAMLLAVDPDHAQQSWELDVAVSGLATEWTSGVQDVTFKLHDNQMISFSASQILVNTDTELIASIAVPLTQAIGLYDVFVDDLMLENAFTVDVLDALDEIALVNQVSVYPNPAVNQLSVDAPLGSEIKVFNIFGQEVLAGLTVQENQLLDVSAFDAGIYILRVFHAGQMTSLRFVKN